MDKLSLTVDERVLLHLRQYADRENQFEMPPEVTQKGIAECVGIHRKHIPRTLRALKTKGMLSEILGHVRGHPQRVRGYFLTRNGLDAAHEMWDHLQREPVFVRSDRGTLEQTNFGQLFFSHQIYLSPIQVFMRLDDQRVFSEEREMDPVDLAPFSRPATSPEHDIKIKIFRAALTRAWQDHVLTVDELGILDELQHVMGITDKERIEIESEITSSTKDKMKAAEVFTATYREAMKDGKITPDELAILDQLQESLGLSAKDRKAIERSVHDSKA